MSATRNNRRPSRQSIKLLADNKLLATTSIEGLSLVHETSKKRKPLEVAFWTFIVTVLFVFTVYNVYKQIRNYLSNDTVTNVHVLQPDESVHLPNLTVCLRAALPLLYCELYVPSQLDFLKSVGVRCIENPPWGSSQLNAAISHGLSKRNTTESFLNSEWPYEFLAVLHPYYEYTSGVETKNMEVYQINRGYMLSSKLIAKNGLMELDLTRKFIILDQIEQILNHAAELEIHPVDLFRKFGKELEKLFMMQTFIDDVIDNGLAFDATFEPVFFSQELNCYRSFLPVANFGRHVVQYQGNLYRFDEMLKEYNVSSSHLRSISSSTYRTAAGTEILGEEPMLAVFVDNVALQGPFPVADVAFKLTGDETTAGIEITAKYDSVERCTENGTRDECMAKCRVETFEKYCNCSPISYWEHVPDWRNKTFCSLVEQPLCVHITSLSDDYNSCTAKCQVNCHVVHYKLTQSQIQGSVGLPMVRISAPLKEFPVFQEDYAQSFQGFLGELGGILDFYLGVSFVAVIHLLLYFAKGTGRFCCGAKNNEL